MDLTLKWGTIKGWDVTGNDKAMTLLKEYFELGSSLSRALQKDIPRQKEIILELIDLCDNPNGIYLSWDNKYVSKKEAKKYVIDYGKDKDKGCRNGMGL
jgi:hypoxanthine-guanine phosphoribosyltransferase